MRIIYDGLRAEARDNAKTYRAPPPFHFAPWVASKCTRLAIKLFLALAFQCWRELDFRNPRRSFDVRTLLENARTNVKNAVSTAAFPLSVGTQRRHRCRDIERH